MKEWLEKYKNQISIAIILAAVIFAAVLIIGKKEPPSFGPIPRTRFGFESKIAASEIEIKFVTKRKIPSKVAVLKIKNKKVSPTQIAKLAGKFGFKGNPKALDPFIWKTGKKEISIRSDLLKVDYSDNDVGRPQKGLSEKGVVEKAKQFLKSKGLLKKNMVISDNTEYLQATKTLFSTVSSFEKAGFVRVTFDLKIGDLFVIERSPLSRVTSVILNKKGQVFKLLYNSVDIESQEEYPIRDKQDASESIKREGFFADIDPETEQPIQPQQFNKLLIEDYFLAYLLDSSASFIQPIYVFRGRGEAGDYVGDSVIYVPALEGKWLR